MSAKIALAVIIPLYNEEEILWELGGQLAQHLDDIIGVGRWQFVLVENGSTDGTGDIVGEMVRRWPLTKHIHMSKANYGHALRTGLQAVEADHAHIINIEQWDVPFIAWAWGYRNRYDLILGSKRADPKINQQSSYRRFLSWGLNAVLQLLFEYPGADTHGPKLLQMRTMRPILEQCVMGRGQFDTEFTIRALRAGLWLAEAPVEYKEYRPPRNFMISKIAWNLRDLLRMRKMIQTLPYLGYVKLHRWSRVDLVEEVQKTPLDQRWQEPRHSELLLERAKSVGE